MQEKVNRFIHKYHLQTDEQTRYIDLVSEIGELGKELVKATDYGKAPFARTEDTADELGDCLFSLLALCCELNVDARAALDAAMAKYETRFARRGNIGSNENER